MAFPKIFAIGAARALAACSGGTPKIAVSDAWARATVPGQTSAAAYLQVANDGDGADTLAGVSAEVGDATIHSSSIYGGIMRMRSLASVAIPAHSVVRFQPSGNHIMITGVNKPLAAGSSFELKLHFKNSGDRAVAVEVRSATTSGMQM
jgi:copper(I)-binding protein